MVRINNSDLSNELRDVAKIQVGADIIPNILSNQVVPVIDVNPKHAREVDKANFAQLTGAATSAIVLTVPLNRKTYISSYNISCKFSNLCTATYFRLRITTAKLGVTSTLSQIINIAAQGTTGVICHDLFRPIELKEGSTITLETDVAEAAAVGCSSVLTYSVDNPNA